MDTLHDPPYPNYSSQKNNSASQPPDQYPIPYPVMVSKFCPYQINMHYVFNFNLMLLYPVVALAPL